MVLRTSDGVPLKVMRSFSKIYTASNFAAAMASSFSFRLPLNETVAIEVFMDTSRRDFTQPETKAFSLIAAASAKARLMRSGSGSTPVNSRNVSTA